MLPPSRCALSARRLPVEQPATTSGEWLPTEVAPRAAQAVWCAVPRAAMAPRRCSASGSMPSGHARWPRRALTIPRSLCIIPLPTAGYRPQRSDIGIALEVEAALGGKAAWSCAMHWSHTSCCSRQPRWCTRSERPRRAPTMPRSLCSFPLQTTPCTSLVRVPTEVSKEHASLTNREPIGCHPWW